MAKLLRGRGGELGYDEVAASAELCELAKRGSLDLLKVLLDCGCPVNAIDYDARTCLHLASSCGSLNICELLIERQADINALDRCRTTGLRRCRVPRLTRGPGVKWRRGSRWRCCLEEAGHRNSGRWSGG